MRDVVPRIYRIAYLRSASPRHTPPGVRGAQYRLRPYGPDGPSLSALLPPGVQFYTLGGPLKNLPLWAIEAHRAVGAVYGFATGLILFRYPNGRKTHVRAYQEIRNFRWLVAMQDGVPVNDPTPAYDRLPGETSNRAERVRALGITTRIIYPY